MLTMPWYLWLPLLMSNDHNGKVLWHMEISLCPFKVKMSRSLMYFLGGINEPYKGAPFKNLKER